MEELRAWLSRFSRLNNCALETQAAARSSTSSEEAVLGALLLAGPVLNPTMLKTLVIQSPGGVTKTLGRLERLGYVRRVRDPADRRALLVELTAKGRRAAVRTVAAVDAYYQELLSDLDEAERAQLGYLLRKVLDRLESLSDMPSDARIVSVMRRAEGQRGREKLPPGAIPPLGEGALGDVGDRRSRGHTARCAGAGDSIRRFSRPAT